MISSLRVTSFRSSDRRSQFADREVLMLSPDELTDGMTFILQLADTRGEPVQWVETLRGDCAKRWYQIYRKSDWEALRAEAADVFHRRVTAAEAEAVRTSRHRCVFIHTPVIKADDLAEGRGSL
jgi:hypothetical protein